MTKMTDQPFQAQRYHGEAYQLLEEEPLIRAADPVTSDELRGRKKVPHLTDHQPPIWEEEHGKTECVKGILTSGAAASFPSYMSRDTRTDRPPKDFWLQLPGWRETARNHV